MKKQIKFIATATVLLAFTQLSHAATATWDGGGANARWNTADNWDTNTAPVSGTDSVVLTPDGGGYATLNVDFTIGSSASLTVDATGGALRGNGGTLTVATGGTLDMATGAGTGLLGNSFGGGTKVVLESGASAAVDTLQLNRTTSVERVTFVADANSAVTLFDVDSLILSTTELVLDLSLATTRLGTYELFDYGTISGFFAEDDISVTGLVGGESFTIDHAYDFGGGDFGVAITVVPEPGTYALLAGLTGLSFVMVRRRRS